MFKVTKSDACLRPFFDDLCQMSIFIICFLSCSKQAQDQSLVADEVREMLLLQSDWLFLFT